MKGFDIAPVVVGAVILAILAIAFVNNFWTSTTIKKDTETEEPVDEGCKRDDDCIDNPDGSICLLIYPGDFSLFCGCLKNEDCKDKRSGVCGAENKCI